MQLSAGQMKVMLIDHLEDNDPSRLKSLRQSKELPAFLETQTEAAVQALQWARESGLTDPAGQIMARDYAIQALLEYPPPISVADEGEEIPDEMIGEAAELFKKWLHVKSGK